MLLVCIWQSARATVVRVTYRVNRPVYSIWYVQKHYRMKNIFFMFACKFDNMLEMSLAKQP